MAPSRKKANLIAVVAPACHVKDLRRHVYTIGHSARQNEIPLDHVEDVLLPKLKEGVSSDLSFLEKIFFSFLGTETNVENKKKLVSFCHKDFH